MGKTPDQQKTLEHIWQTLCEGQRRSSEAVRVVSMKVDQ